MLVTQSCLTLYPMDCSPPGSSVHGILQARILEWASISFSRVLPNPGIEPRSPALWANSLPAEPQGKPKNTRVGNLSLLQGIFLTQESNRGLLHCKRIFYQLSYQGRILLFKPFLHLRMANGDSPNPRSRADMVPYFVELWNLPLPFHLWLIS